MLKEKWSKGKEAGCVVSDTPNRHNRNDDHIGYYGGYLVAESIPKQEYVNLIAAAPDLLEACEAAKTLIEDMARFVGVMALKNYALFNEAPIALNRAITKAHGESEAQDG